jgi:N utilization substance protein B
LSQTPDVPGPDAAPQVSAPDQAEQVETTDAASDDAPAGAAHARTARTKARHRALDVRFEADAKGLIGSGADVLRVLADRRRRTVAQDGLPTYAIDLVQGVADHIEIIDEIIETNAREWTLRRMPAVDRGLLRLGVLEIVFLDGLEDAVAIQQATLLARELSTDDSPRFIEGVLQEVARTKAVYRD